MVSHGGTAPGRAGRFAVVTGANRGLGMEVCRQLRDGGFQVVLTGRDDEAVRTAAATLSTRDRPVLPHVLDVADQASVDRLADFVAGRFGRADVLVSNAAVYLDHPRQGAHAGVDHLDLDLLRRTFDVNLFGAIRLVQAFLPGMRAAGYGRIVNVSSGMGRYIELDHDAIAYRLSKNALNALTVIVERDLESDPDHGDVLVNAVCPGWVRTRMGGRDGLRSVEEGAAGVVLAATLPAGGPSGRLLRDGKDFGW